MNIQPRPRVLQGVAGGSTAALLAQIFQHRLGMELIPAEMALIAIVMGFLSQWLMKKRADD